MLSLFVTQVSVKGLTLMRMVKLVLNNNYLEQEKIMLKALIQ